jgi:hypothetical protein
MNEYFELDEDARTVIAAGRDGQEPTELARARVRRAVQLGLASGVSTFGRPRVELPSSAKVVAALAVAGTVAAGAWYAHERSAPRPTMRPAAGSTQAPPVVPTPRITAASPLPSGAPEVASPTPSRAPRIPPGRTDELAAEIALLSQVNVAINSGQAERAFALLSEYDHRYSPGVLREERAAAGVLALCAAGRADAARSAAGRFEKRWPRSPLLARIGGSCAGPK